MKTFTRLDGETWTDMIKRLLQEKQMVVPCMIFIAKENKLYEINESGEIQEKEWPKENGRTFDKVWIDEFKESLPIINPYSELKSIERLLPDRPEKPKHIHQKKPFKSKQKGSYRPHRNTNMRGKR